MSTLPSEIEIELGLDEADDEATLRRKAARKAGVGVDDLPEIALRKRSIDARHGRVVFRLLLEVAPEPSELGAPHPVDVDRLGRVVVIGEGPAGLFCAYELARRGIGCTVVDRGKTVQPRRRDLRGLNQLGVVDPDSNYCFGEGGAGTYSDGKLYTRSHKRGDCRDVLEVLRLHGAPEAILTDARPHIREQQASQGHHGDAGASRAPRRRVPLWRAGRRAGHQRRRRAATGEGRAPRGRRGDRRRRGGPRHRTLGPRHLPDAPRPRDRADAEALRPGRPDRAPAAVHQRDPVRAVRGSPQAPECGVPAHPHRVGEGGLHLLHVPGRLRGAGVHHRGRAGPERHEPVQAQLAVRELRAGGGNRGRGRPTGRLQRPTRRHRAPTAHRAGRLAGRRGRAAGPGHARYGLPGGRASSTVPDTSYQPGLAGADVGEVLDVVGLGLADRMRRALRVFEKKMRGYVTDEAVLLGVESRTSSPVRVPRDPERLENPDLVGLYPCGEGAGYAGGIMSAAMDGMKVARNVAATLG